MSSRAVSALLVLVVWIVMTSPRTGCAQEEGSAGSVEPKTGAEQFRTHARLAMLRAVPVKWDLDANFKVFLQGVDLAAQHQAEIVITPECWLDGYASPDKTSTPERIRGIAQDLQTSPYVKQVADAARAHHLFICFGFTSLEEGQAYNAAGLWDPEGHRIGLYHKTHLQAHDLQYASGQSLPVWPTPWGPVGIMICADRRWPETTRALRLQGAKLILNPTYGFYNDLNEAMMRTRAYENQCFIAFTHPKQSLVTGPNGKVLLKEDGTEDEASAAHVAICDVDLTRASDDNHLKDRRPDIYKIITKE
jgi:predicted amidohydrolase